MNVKCNKYHDLIMRHFDHILNENESEQLYQHIDSCPDCRALMNDLQGIMQTLETSPAVEPPTDLEKLVMNRIQSLPVPVEHSEHNFLKALYGSISVIAVMLACAATLGLYDGILSVLSQGAGSLNSFLDNAWNFQVVYNLLYDVFSQMVYSVLSTIQSVYIIAGFAAIVVGLKKLLHPGQALHKAGD